MIATIINALAIVIAGTIGSLFGNRIGEKYSKAVMTVMALVTASIGVQSVITASSILIVVICLVFGIVLGTLLKLDDGINNLGDKVKTAFSKTKLGSGSFCEALVTTSMLFCVGTMAILGSVQAGLNHDYSILLTKSVMDFVSALAFSAALGPGVIFSAIPVLLVQGSVTLLAGAAAPYLTQEVVTEMSAVGGPIFMAMAINLLGLRSEKIKVGDMLPAIFIPIIYFPLTSLVTKLF